MPRWGGVRVKRVEGVTQVERVMSRISLVKLLFPSEVAETAKFTSFDTYPGGGVAGW